MKSQRAFSLKTNRDRQTTARDRATRGLRRTNVKKKDNEVARSPDVGLGRVERFAVVTNVLRRVKGAERQTVEKVARREQAGDGTQTKAVHAPPNDQRKER